ncbi:MAG: NADP-specific glutamate dehydrogenase [Phycisphaerales bacterium]|nr:NADP-specific glutamate dehydrogenase [Phycisphaerales bacterium]
MTTADAVFDLSSSIDKMNPGPLYRSAIDEVAESIAPVIRDNQKYQDARVFERLLIPDRVIRFRVEWVNDEGGVEVNLGWRIEHSNVLGPYKGGLRFHPSVTEDTLHFLAYEQCFKNALTGQPIGGGKGGSNFDPKGKSDNEVMRFCQAFMRELYRHIGPSVDVPAGDIGVGGREIGFLYGQYMKITKQRDGVLTGKPLGLGGLLGRTEATGYGTVTFAEAMLKHADESMDGKRVMISGSGNVALYAAELAIEKGAKVVSLSDSGGSVVFDKGMSSEQLEELTQYKEVERGRLKDWSGNGAEFHADKRPWSLVDADVALPCATQHEVEKDDAAALADRGVKCVAEGANMPCTHKARDIFHAKGVMFGPGKAANAGGVATSCFEMSQNASHSSWTKKQALDKLEGVMLDIHEQCLEHAPMNNGVVDYGVGADRGGFVKLADAIIAMGV